MSTASSLSRCLLAALVLVLQVPFASASPKHQVLMQKPMKGHHHSKHSKAGLLEEHERTHGRARVSEDSARHGKKHSATKTKANRAEHATCTDLINHGTHFTVEIEVGTPGQKFDVVADTGSDAIIVPSCACVKAGYCNAKSRCFTGTNRSSTFAIDNGPAGPPTIRMMFGSGPVQAVVASDTVRVGALHTKMNDGILLMTDQLLNIKGQFEGILGLGLPSSDVKTGLYHDSSEGEQAGAQTAEQTVSGPTDAPLVPASKKDESEYVQGKGQMVAPFERSNGVNIFPFPIEGGDSASTVEGFSSVERSQAIMDDSDSMPTMNLAPTSFVALPKKDTTAAAAKKPLAKEETPAAADSNSSGLVVKGFMEEAGIDRFSMCFNDGASGVLRLGTPKNERSHGSIGQVHWGLDFRGISVGKVSAPVKFCKPEEMGKGQQTPCGAIPDSGTTAFMAPKEHLLSLYESLCDEWDRCSKNYTAMVKASKDAKAAAVKAFHSDPFHIEATSKSVIFQQLVMDCSSWLTEGKGLNELPPIHFHIGGAGGTKQTLDLGGWSYIIETQEKEFKYIYKNVPGLGKLPMGKNFTGNSKKVCSPAFSTMEYSTEQNGPVWILGTPIFYEYQVGYDLGTKPPAISFANTACGSCGGAKPKTSLVSQDTSTHKARSHRSMHSPRKVLGPLRMPNMDFTQPL